MAESDQAPFGDLPAALVQEVISEARDAGGRLLATFESVRLDRSSLRAALDRLGLIQHEAEYGCPTPPTTCAADGSYAMERLLTADFAAAAAVAVEGLTPPSETRHWDSPHHSTFVAVEEHHEKTATMLRTVMLGRELILATRAPHDLVMLDATLTLPVIYINQALNSMRETEGLNCSQEFGANVREYLNAYASILESHRSDKNYAALPKYSTRREIGRLAEWSGKHDDRGLLTLLLRPGELTKPLALESPTSPWHINLSPIAPRLDRGAAQELNERVLQGIQHVHVFYYKPQPWLPALRVEVSSAVANNRHRLAIVLQGLKSQCATGAMLEPYPLYLADRMVKSLTYALPAFRQVATQQIAEEYAGDISEVFFAMHGYRTETGR